MCRIDDQFMLGDRLLVAPVLKAGQRSRSVYLPTPLEGSGVWKRETDGTFFEGGQWLHNSRLGYPCSTKYVHIYKEYHSVCPLVGIGTLPTPLSPASVPLPPEPGGGGGTLACGWGVGVLTLWYPGFLSQADQVCKYILYSDQCCGSGYSISNESGSGSGFSGYTTLG